MAAKASYLCLTLLLLVGTQLATSKSVDEKFKDSSLVLSKRAVANEDSKEASAESSDDKLAPAPKPAKGRRQATTATEPTTTPSDDDDEATTSPPEDSQENSAAEEEVATVAPLENDKKKATKRPKVPAPDLANRIMPEEEPAERPAERPASQPAARPQVAPRPQLPASNLLPPMPYYPQNFGSLPNPAFAAPWALYPAPGPSPYVYPQPSGPAFSDSKVAGAGGNGFGFASASASAGGQGSTITTSSSSPNGAAQSSHAYSSSAGPVRSVGVRGSFGGGPEDSVAIEVNGRPATGVPTYNAQPGYGSISGPGYSSSASFGSAPYYMNTIPSYGYAGAGDFNNFFQQYFAAMQAQQQAFQQQLQAQIQAQQQAHGAYASGGAFITNDQGVVDPNANVYVNTMTSPSSASSSTMVNSRFGVGHTQSSVQAYPSGRPNSTGNNNSNNRIWEQNNFIDSNNMGLPGTSFYRGSDGPASAVSSINLGPQGGYQAAEVSPAGPGIFSRVGEGLPPPSGNNYGVFSSSSSSSSTGPDGKTVSHKTATVGVNDNGKVTYKTVHDP